MLTYEAATNRWVAETFGIEYDEIRTVHIMLDEEPGSLFITIWLKGKSHKETLIRRWSPEGPYQFIYELMRIGIGYYKPTSSTEVVDL